MSFARPVDADLPRRNNVENLAFKFLDGPSSPFAVEVFQRRVKGLSPCAAEAIVSEVSFFPNPHDILMNPEFANDPFALDALRHNKRQLAPDVQHGQQEEERGDERCW